MRRFGRRNARGGNAGGASLGVIGATPNLHSWFRADLGVTATQWVSRVNGYAFEQLTGSKFPSSATGTELNSKPVLRFNGTSHVLVSTAAASAWRFLHDGTGYTFFAVCTPRASAAIYLLGTILTTGGTGKWLRVDGPSGGVYSVTYNVATPVINRTVTHATIANDTGLIYSESYQESITPEVDIHTAGVSRSSGASSSAPNAGDSAGTLAVGGLADVAFGKYDVAELIFYNRVLSAGERTAVYNTLAARYVP